MTDAQKYRMRLIRAHMDYITAEINDIDSKIENMISSNTDYENAVQLLCTIPGVKRDSAITIISEISTVCPCSRNLQQISLLQKEIGVSCKTSWQEKSHYCYCPYDAHCCLPDAVYW